MNKEILRMLRESGLSEEMKSLENCDFLAIVEYSGKIIAASGIGGIFHVPSLQVLPEFKNKGLGGKLFGLVIKEAKNRNYSFISGSRNPENINAVRLHDFYGLKPIFQIKYAPELTRDIVILTFNKRGKVVSLLLNVFNNLIGMAILVFALKIFKKILFKSFLTYPEEEFPSPDITFAIKNFKKLKQLE